MSNALDDQLGINPLLTIYRLLAIHKDMAETIHEKVKRLRDAGLTFEEIGGAINKTRQRAYQLYQEAVSSKIQSV